MPPRHIADYMPALAVAIPTDVQLLCVVLQTADVRVQCLHGTLKHGLSFSTPVNEDDVLLSLDAFQTSAQTFQMVQANLRATAQVDTELFFYAGKKGVEFLHEFGTVLCNAFFPNEGVLARNCFDLCAVDKEVLKRDGSNGCKKLCHLCQNLLGAGGKVIPAKTGNGCVIRCGSPFEQIHEVDVPEAYLLNAAGTVDLIHVCVDEDGKQLMR